MISEFHQHQLYEKKFFFKKLRNIFYDLFIIVLLLFVARFNKLIFSYILKKSDIKDKESLMIKGLKIINT